MRTIEDNTEYNIHARFSKPPNANDGGFLNSLGVAAGIPMIMARHRLLKHVYVSFILYGHSGYTRI